jgi:hypothetical protein
LIFYFLTVVELIPALADDSIYLPVVLDLIYRTSTKLYTMASLRRPSVYMPAGVNISPQKPARRDEPSSSSKNSKLNARKSRVGDAIKKRLSMRLVHGPLVLYKTLEADTQGMPEETK